MNNYFQTLVTHLDEWALNAADVLSTEDVIWQHLITPSEHDPLVQVIIQSLFYAFSALITRLVDDVENMMSLLHSYR